MAGEVISAALPRRQGHHQALPYREIGPALAAFKARNASLAKACLRFIALTAVRSREGRGAKWAVVDLQGRDWRIPGDRMKNGR